MDIEHRAKMRFLASFTVSSIHVLLFSSTVNFWMICSSAKWRWDGAKSRFRRDFVSGSNIFHTSQHIFFPRPVNDETMSHPVKLCNSRRSAALHRPRFDAIL